MRPFFYLFSPITMSEKLHVIHERLEIDTCIYCGLLVHVFPNSVPSLVARPRQGIVEPNDGDTGYKTEDNTFIHYRRFCADKSRTRYKKNAEGWAELVRLSKTFVPGRNRELLGVRSGKK